MPVRIAVAGATGRMGRELVRLAGSEDCVLAGGTVRPGSPDMGKDMGMACCGAPSGVTLTGSAVRAAATAGVWIDFTPPPVCVASLDAIGSASDLPVRAAIIGGTGFAGDQMTRIDAHGTHLAVVRSGNFSLGIHLLRRLVSALAASLGDAWDVDILDTHHRDKRDAPSGTALLLRDALGSGRRTQTDGPRTPGSVAMLARRSGGIFGEHEVIFSSRHETISVGHRALDRAVFAQGALAAALWAADKSPGLYDMDDVFDG